MFNKLVSKLSKQISTNQVVRIFSHETRTRVEVVIYDALLWSVCEVGVIQRTNIMTFFGFKTS